MRNRFLFVLLLLSWLLSYSAAQKLGQLNLEPNGVGDYPAGITGGLINPSSPEPSLPREPDFGNKPKCVFGDSLECVARDLAEREP